MNSPVQSNALSEATPEIGILHFDEVLVEEITNGGRALTAPEREFLVKDVVHMEECQHSESELRAMDDPTLMNSAFWCWSNYANGQIDRE